MGNSREIVVSPTNSHIENEIKLLIKWSVLETSLAPWITRDSLVYSTAGKITIGPHVLVFGKVKVEDLLESDVELASVLRR